MCYIAKWVDNYHNGLQCRRFLAAGEGYLDVFAC